MPAGSTTALLAEKYGSDPVYASKCLQFPAGWEEAKRIKFALGFDRPAPRDYVGPMPLSEPESVAMYQFTKMHDFALILAYHTQGEVIYWRYLNYEPEKSYVIAQYFTRVSGYAVEETRSTRFRTQNARRKTSSPVSHQNRRIERQTTPNAWR